jgi:hypothetical protein
LAAAGLLASVPDADAQRYRARGRVHGHGHGHGGAAVVIYPRGLYFGVGLLGNLVLAQSGGDELLDSGGGLSLYGGWRVMDRLALELGYMGSAHNPAGVDIGPYRDVDYLILNGFTGDARIYLGDPMAPSEWYLQGGLGLYLLDSTYFGAQSVGSGFQLGGGIDFHVAPAVDLGLRGLYRGISMGPPESRQDDTFLSALTIEGNLTFRF